MYTTFTVLPQNGFKPFGLRRKYKHPRSSCSIGPIQCRPILKSQNTGTPTKWIFGFDWLRSDKRFTLSFLVDGDDAEVILLTLIKVLRRRLSLVGVNMARTLGPLGRTFRPFLENVAFNARSAVVFRRFPLQLNGGRRRLNGFKWTLWRRRLIYTNTEITQFDEELRGLCSGLKGVKDPNIYLPSFRLTWKPEQQRFTIIRSGVLTGTCLLYTSPSPRD